MELDNVKNFAKVVVSTGYDASATSVELNSGDGAKLPEAPFNLVWWNSTDYPDPADDPDVEIVRATNVSSDTVDIDRAQEGTTARDHHADGKTYKMALVITKKLRDDLNAIFIGFPQDFVFTPADPQGTTGSELVTDGDFSADPGSNGWVLGDG